MAKYPNSGDPSPSKANFAQTLSRPQAGTLAGAILAGMEFAALGRISSGLWWIAGSLLIYYGALVGWIADLQEGLIARRGFRGYRAQLVRAFPLLILSAPAVGPSFEGAFASTLPGAASAAYWMPLLFFLGFAALLHLWEQIQHRAKAENWRLPIETILVALLSVGAAYLEIANRRVRFTEYPDAHTLAIGIALVAIFVALRLTALEVAMPSFERLRHLPVRTKRFAFVGVLVLNFLLILAFGLSSPEDRLHLANQSMHTRMLVRSVRSIFDLDRDSYGSVLNGSDCDEFNPARNPGQAEIPDNAVDEDCDGIAAQTPRIAGDQSENLARAQVAWQANAKRQEMVRNAQQYHIVLITVDALRADMLADTPQNRRDFPNLFTLLESSTHFIRAFSPAAGTDLSMASLFSGKVDAFAGSKRTLFEGLSRAGFVTHGVIPREVLRYAGQTILTRGLDGFDRVVNDPERRDIGGRATAKKSSELGLAAFDRFRQNNRAARIGLWVHYFDTHEHDQLPAELLPTHSLAPDPTPSPVETRYRAATKLVDQGIGDLFDGLRARKVWDHTIIVLASDHGESLGEDPRLPQNHGRFVYNSLVHIPLAIYVPGLKSREVETPISLIDLYPTILELASARGADFDGKSLTPFLVEDAPAELIEQRRMIALNESDQRGLIAWPYKYVRRPVDNYVELFDLRHDFGESNNLVGHADHVHTLAEMAGLLSGLPTFVIDRTRKGRAAREILARAPANAGEP